MAYSDSLIREVKELYPNDRKMHELADSGNAFLGRYLDDSSSTSIQIDTILKSNSLTELQQMALQMRRKIELYKRWCNEDPRPKLY